MSDRSPLPRSWSRNSGGGGDNEISGYDDHKLTRPPSFNPSTNDTIPYPTFRSSSYPASEPRSFTTHLAHPEPAYKYPQSHDDDDDSTLVLPWNTPISYHTEPPMPEALKEERIRMLEQEFGDHKAEDIKVNPFETRGPPGPRKRAALRFAQGILSLGTALSSLYVALVR